MCPREVRKIEDLDRKATKSLEMTNWKLKALLAAMTDVKEECEVSRLDYDKEVENILEGTNQKLDTLLVKLLESKKEVQNVS